MSTDTEKAWAAGFFDGEGCVTQSGGTWHVTVNQTEQTRLERFQRALGVGRVSGPYAGKNERASPWWQYTLTRQQDMVAGFWMLQSYLSDEKKSEWFQLVASLGAPRKTTGVRPLKAGRPFPHGLVIGKFSPPHTGHQFLINYASDLSQRLTVIVVHYKNRPDVYIETVAKRIEWLKEIHIKRKNISFIPFEPAETMPDIDDDAWAKETVRLAGDDINALFSFEFERDKGYATALNAGFFMPPGTPPIRATLIRNSPEIYKMYLHPIVRAYYKEQSQ